MILMTAICIAYERLKSSSHAQDFLSGTAPHGHSAGLARSLQVASRLRSGWRCRSSGAGSDPINRIRARRIVSGFDSYRPVTSNSILLAHSPKSRSANPKYFSRRSNHAITLFQCLTDSGHFLFFGHRRALLDPFINDGHGLSKFRR